MRGVCPKQNQRIQEAKEQMEALRPYDILKEIFERKPENVSQRAEKAWNDNVETLEDFDTLIQTGKL